MPAKSDTQTPEGATPEDRERYYPSWWLMRLAWGARGNLDALCMAIVRRVLPENDGTIATKIFRGGGCKKAAFFRGVADAADEANS